MKKTYLLFLALLPLLFAGLVSCGNKESDSKTDAYGIQCNRTGTMDGNNVDRRMVDELLTQAVKNWEADHQLYWTDASASAEAEAKKRFQEAYDDLKDVIAVINRDLSNSTGAAIYQDVDFDLTWTLTLYHRLPSNTIDGPREVKFRLKTVKGGTVEGPEA